MSLRERLAERIGAEGPIDVSTYMDVCLHDPADGYYATRPRLGEPGDFITAPHLSQMFGELIGLWSAEIWSQLGRPPRVLLIELGPGDGKMMGDMLRAAAAAPGFLQACEVWLVETSGPLKAVQQAALADARAPVRWAEDYDDLPRDAPVILVANEFLDCLPIRQFVRTQQGWSERRVGADEAGALTFTTLPGKPDDIGCLDWVGLAEGAVVEVSRPLTDLAVAIGGWIVRAAGAALFIDYGRSRRETGDTLQAVRGHVAEHPLANPGRADLTAHVDFPAFAAAARAAGARVAPIATQRDFLRDLGIDKRAAALAAANPGRAATIGRQRDRLIGADRMGDLFKVVCVHSAGLSPPGLGDPR
jgi:SAM-dependent MidA family methyltransferase